MTSFQVHVKETFMGRAEQCLLFDRYYYTQTPVGKHKQWSSIVAIMRRNRYLLVATIDVEEFSIENLKSCFLALGRQGHSNFHKCQLRDV